MKVVIDTNVLISGVFFKGPPNQIIQAWRDGKIQFVISLDILKEYSRVGEELSGHFPNIDLDPILHLLYLKSDLVPVTKLPEAVCEDRDDDKFIACALSSKTKVIISGDKHLLKVSGYHEIQVLSPRKFVDEYLKDSGQGT